MGTDTERVKAAARIEAEQIDLTAQRDHYQREFDKAEAEVERLQRVLRDADAELEAEREARPKMEAEVERLRTLNESYSDLLHERETEVERLRADKVKLAQGILPAGAVVTFEEKE